MSNRDIHKGFTFKIAHRVYEDGAPVDLTGKTAKLTLKANPATAGAGLVTLTSPAGGITFLDQTQAATRGKMVCKFTRAQTDALAAGTYFYDIALIDGADMWNTTGVEKVVVVVSPNDDAP